MIASVAALLVVLQTPPVTSYTDLVYSTVDQIELRLDIHVPSNATKAPLIVWIHGGGWQGGDKSQCVPAKTFQARNPEYAVASINYRLSQQAIFPAQLIDCKTAIAWLRANAATYKIDASRVAVWGNSAGGHLAALVGTTAGWQGVSAAVDRGSRVSAVVDYFGPTDLISFVQTPGYTSSALPTSGASLLIGGPVLENLKAARNASPSEYVTSDDAPHFIVHGTNDPLVPAAQSQLLHDLLTAKRVQSTLTLIPNAGHGGLPFINPSLLDRVATFIRKSFSSNQTPR